MHQTRASTVATRTAKPATGKLIDAIIDGMNRIFEVLVPQPQPVPVRVKAGRPQGRR